MPHSQLAGARPPSARLIKSPRIEPRAIPIGPNGEPEPMSAADAAHADALARAYERGRADAAADFAASAEAACERGAAALAALVNQLGADRSEGVHVAQRAVIAAAIDVAEWVLRQPLTETTKGLLARLGESAEALLPGATVTVVVSPTDADAVRRWAATQPGVTVTTDAAMNPGDARMQSDDGSADVSVAAALRVAAEMLGVDPGRYPA